VVSRRRVMRKGRTAGTVFAGAGAAGLAVLLSVCGAGAASSSVVPALRIPGRAVSAPAAIAAARGHVWVANSLYPVTGNAGGWVTELNAETGALIRVVSARRDRLTDPEAIAVAGNRVWVVNSFGNSVTVINATTGAYYDQSGGWVTELSAATGALVRVISG
jgi:DNA-binding beta-propeller fold protein YncE